VQKPIAPT